MSDIPPPTNGKKDESFIVIPDSPMEIDEPEATENRVLLEEEFMRKVSATLHLLTTRMEQLQLQIEQNGVNGRVNDSPPKTGEEIFEDIPKKRMKNGKKAKDETNFRQTVRDRIQDRFGFKPSQRIAEWPCAEGPRCQGYNAELLPQDGPTPEYLVIDWTEKGLTLWLTDCLTIFTHEFLLEHKNGGFPLLRDSVTKTRVYGASRDYILYLKRRYRKEIEDPMMAAAARDLAEQRSRSLNRRQQLLGRRLALMHHHAFPAAAIEAVEELDVDGMSSEASEGEVGVRRSFRIKHLPWRSPTLTNWLQRIDGMPTKNAQNAVLTRRCNYRHRTWSDQVSTKRGPVKGLPVNLYNQAWITAQGDRAVRRLAIVKEPLSLPKIDDLTPGV